MKLSIVTPSYNQGQFIGNTFQSILEQKPLPLPLEYIIIDAVSKDTTKDVIEEYLPRFRTAGIEVKYICEKDRGQSDAINKGWRMCTGDIITYLNSDDYYNPNILAVVVDFFIHHPNASWAYGGWNLVSKTGKIFHTVQPKEFSRDALLNYCNIGQPSCFFKKELLGEFGMLNEDLHLAMDYDLWLRFASKYDAKIIPVIASNMRYYAEAKSSSQTMQQIKEVYCIGKQYTKALSFRRLMQYYYYLRGVWATRLRVSTIQKADLR